MGDISKLIGMVSELAVKVDRIEASMGTKDVMSDRIGGRGRPQKYNCDALFTDGKFLTECGKGEHDRLVRSLSAGANQKFGKGKVRVKKVGVGVWAIRKGDWWSVTSQGPF